MSLMEELKSTSSEMPWFMAAVLLAITMCIGVQAEIVSGADGDRPRVAMGRAEMSMAHIADACERRARNCISVSAPGVTMMLRARGYWIEMTIPTSVLAERVEAVRSRLSGLECTSRRSSGSWSRV